MDIVQNKKVPDTTLSWFGTIFDTFEPKQDG